MIGLFPEMAYEEAEIDLRPGDLLVAFTDGVPKRSTRTGRSSARNGSKRSCAGRSEQRRQRLPRSWPPGYASGSGAPNNTTT